MMSGSSFLVFPLAFEHPRLYIVTRYGNGRVIEMHSMPRTSSSLAYSLMEGGHIA
jgi:hypothetical protein